MIIVLIHWLYIFLVSFSVGFLATRLINWVWRGKEVFTIPLDFMLMFGLSILGGAMALVSLISPIGITTNAIIYAASFLGLFAFKREVVEYWRWIGTELKTFNYWSLYILCVGGGLLMLVYAASEPFEYDTGLYHAQTIMWNESYPVVPGLGNLHGRFAFNSAHFILEAFFQLSPLKSGVFFTLNSFLLAMVLVRCALGTIGSLRDLNWRMSYFYVLAGTIICVLTAPIASSAGNDMALLIIVFYAVLTVLRGSLSMSRMSFSILTALCLYALIVKFSSMALCLLPLGALLFSDVERSARFRFFAVAALLFGIPFIARNIIISGYLLYPFDAIDWLNVDWKIPAEKVRSELASVKCWARIPYRNCQEVLALSTSEWIGTWWESKPTLQRIILIINLASPAAYITAIFRKERVQEYVLIGSVLLLSLIMWFFAAPEFRFAFGFLIVNGALAISVVANFASRLGRLLLVPIMAVLIWFVFQIPPHIYDVQYVSDLVYHPRTLQTAQTRSVQLANFIVNVPQEGDRCFAQALPCTPYPNAQLALRGPDFNDGFRMDDDKYYNIEARALLDKESSQAVRVDSGLQIHYYEDEQRIMYEFSDTSSYKLRFYLHINPLNPSLLETGTDFDNLDFDWEHVERAFQGKYYLVRKLPDYQIRSIGTGQFNDSGRTWAASIIVNESAEK